MKIEGRRAQIRQALESKGAEAVRELLTQAQATPAEIRSVAEEMGRHDIEKVLGVELARTVEAPSQGKKAHDVRAKKQPWWSGLALLEPLHPEPTRDVDVHGEKFSKADVTDMLRSIGR